MLISKTTHRSVFPGYKRPSIIQWQLFLRPDSSMILLLRYGTNRCRVLSGFPLEIR